MAPVHVTLRAIYRYRPELARGVVLHFVAWVGSGLEGYFALHLMGIGVGLGAVLTIESLLYTLLRTVALQARATSLSVHLRSWHGKR